jgi:hypothetical protein
MILCLETLIIKHFVVYWIKLWAYNFYKIIHQPFIILRPSFSLCLIVSSYSLTSLNVFFLISQFVRTVRDDNVMIMIFQNVHFCANEKHYCAHAFHGRFLSTMIAISLWFWINFFIDYYYYYMINYIICLLYYSFHFYGINVINRFFFYESCVILINRDSDYVFFIGIILFLCVCFGYLKIYQSLVILLHLFLRW